MFFLVPLYKKFSQMTEYVKYNNNNNFDNNNKYMNFLVQDKEVLNKYYKIWDKIKHLL